MALEEVDVDGPADMAERVDVAGRADMAEEDNVYTDNVIHPTLTCPIQYVHELEQDKVSNQSNEEVLSVHNLSSGASDSEDESDDEPLFCSSDLCTLTHLILAEQNKHKWVQCVSCLDWFHERCINKICTACKSYIFLSE